MAGLDVKKMQDRIYYFKRVRNILNYHLIKELRYESDLLYGLLLNIAREWSVTCLSWILKIFYEMSECKQMPWTDQITCDTDG